MSTEDYITPAQAADIKQVSRQTVYSAIARGAIPSARILGRLAVSRSDVEAWQPATYGEVERAKIIRGPGRPRKLAQVASEA